MTKLPTIRTANTLLVQSQPLVAVFAGGTSGIGKSTLRNLLKLHATKGGQGIRVYMVSRKEAKIQDIVSEFATAQGVTPACEIVFINGEELSQLKCVDRACAEIIAKEEEQAKKSGDGKPARVDILCMSYADLNFGPFNETPEGLDKSLSLRYYSRMRMLHNLLPLLLSSQLPAHVISVFAGGFESAGKFFPQDLTLRDPTHFSFSNVRTHAVYMKTLFFETLAQQHPGKLVLSHAYPGFVESEAMNDKSKYEGIKPGYRWLLTVFKYVLVPLLRLFFTTPKPESGERHLYLATADWKPRDAKATVITSAAAKILVKKDPTVKMSTDLVPNGGAYSVGRMSDANVYEEKTYAQLKKDGFQEKVWEHTMAVFETIEKGEKFEG